MSVTAIVGCIDCIDVVIFIVGASDFTNLARIGVHHINAFTIIVHGGDLLHAALDAAYYMGDSRPYAVLQRTPDEDCRQAEEPKQLADEASRLHLGRQRQHSAVICSGALLFSSRVLRPSLVTLCSHKSGQCTVELYHASHLWYPPFYTSPMASSALQH